MNKVDGRISIVTRCRCGKSKESCQHITLEEDRAKTSSILADRSSATASGAVRSSALGLTVMESWVQASRLSEIDSFIGQELQSVELEFRTVKDKVDFEAAFDVLKHQYETLLGAERHGSDHQSLGEPGSLTGYESAAFDAGAGMSGIESDEFSIEKETMQPSLRQKSIAKYYEDSKYYEGSKYDGRSKDPKYYILGTKDSRSYEGSKYDGRSEDPKYYDLGSKDSSKEGSKITSLLPFPSGFESELSASSTSETSGFEKQGSTSVTQVTRESRRASIETSAKQEQWRRRICRKIIVFMLWEREQDVCLPNEFWSSPASFEFISVLEVSPFDKIKGLFETYSGMEWNWWPFDPTAKPLESGKVRIRWQCVGELNSDNTTC